MSTMTDPADESQKLARLETIRQALQDKAPLTYEKLESSGQLQKFLEDRDEEMIESYNYQKNKAWDNTMATFLNFTDADTSYDETSSPM
jgi:hypothetical protein